MKISVNSPCPCGSSKKYKKCCQIYHKGAKAKDALTLMKSRYSAFSVGEIRYIINSSTSQDNFLDLMSFSDSCKFKKLDILEFCDGDSEAFVTFKATIFCDGLDNSFVERSRFVKEDGRWLYESGEIIG
jgi:SEC-C motif-containing protein